MTRLSDFFIAFCVSSVFIGVLLIICPSGAMSKPIKNLLCLTFILIITASAFKIDFNLNFNTHADSPHTNTQSIDTSSAIYVYGECLNAAKIKFSKISVLTTKTDNGDIVISKVLIFSKEDKNKILLALGEVAQNFEVEIINEWFN